MKSRPLTLAVLSCFWGLAVCPAPPAAAQQAGAASPQAAPKLFAFRGQVLLEESRTALPGVTVRLSRYSETTDAQGRFSFQGIPEGSYLVQLEFEGHVQAGNRPRIGVTLSGHVKIPFMTLRMTRVSGVEGFVEDKDHNPLSGVQVNLVEKLIAAGNPVLRRYERATTDDSGAFSIAAPPGEYYLYASPASLRKETTEKAPRGTPQMIGTFYPASTDLEGAAPVVLYPAAPLTGLKLEVQTDVLYTVSGRVEGAESHTADLTKIAIEFRRTSGPESSVPAFGSNMPGDDKLTSKAAADGTFSIEGVAPGSYLAFASFEGATVGSARVTVSDRDIEKLPVVALPVAVFSGRIVQEDPKYDGKITLRLQGHDSLGFRSYSAPITESGEFSVQGVAPGAYLMSLDADQWLFVTRIELPAKSFQGPKFDLEPGGSDRAVVRVGSQGGTIAGRVQGGTRPESQPRGLVSLVMTPTSFLELNNLLPAFLAADGSFVAEYLQPGRYRVCAWREQDNDFITILSNPHLQTRLDRVCETVEVEAGERKFVTLEPITASDLAR